MGRKKKYRDPKLLVNRPKYHDTEIDGVGAVRDLAKAKEYYIMARDLGYDCKRKLEAIGAELNK